MTIDFVEIPYEEPDEKDRELEQDLRNIVFKQIIPVTYPADTFSGYDIDHYDWDDPEQLIVDLFDYIKDRERNEQKN